MKYLNPDLSEVQDAEVIAAAKFIHLTSKWVEARNIQVDQMKSTFHDFMLRADDRVGIDKRPATQCCVIADVLHHGRGGKNPWPLIDAALKSAKPFEALVEIGAPTWNERKKTLKNAINARPDLAAKAWSRTKKDFV